MKSLIPYEAGTFYALGKGHALLTCDVGPTEFSLGTSYELNSMMSMQELLIDTRSVGFYFYSGFTVVNRGGFLVTYLKTKKARAETYELVVRLPELIVFSYPGVGALAISTKVNTMVNSIFSEQ